MQLFIIRCLKESPPVFLSDGMVTNMWKYFCLKPMLAKFVVCVETLMAILPMNISHQLVVR